MEQLHRDYSCEKSPILENKIPTTDSNWVEKAIAQVYLVTRKELPTPEQITNVVQKLGIAQITEGEE